MLLHSDLKLGSGSVLNARIMLSLSSRAHQMAMIWAVATLKNTVTFADSPVGTSHAIRGQVCRDHG